jgi:hypothetical protein
MASSMEERQQAFESKFARDAELKFKAQARRDRLIGIWAAGHLGKTAEDTENYVREVIREDLREGGDEDVFRKIRSDFDAAGVKVSDEDIRRTMVAMMAEAVDQIQNN